MPPRRAASHSSPAFQIKATSFNKIILLILLQRFCIIAHLPLSLGKRYVVPESMDYSGYCDWSFDGWACLSFSILLTFFILFNGNLIFFQWQLEYLFFVMMLLEGGLGSK